MTLTPEQITKYREAAGLAPLSPTGTVQPVQKSLRERLGLNVTPVDPIETKPSFQASMGGAETILPNIAKTIGNIPSSAKNVVGEGIVRPIDNAVKSTKIASDIYKDRGAVEGTKDIVSGFADTYKKVGQTIVDTLDKGDLISKLAPIQEEALRHRDEYLQKLQDAKKEGKDTKHIIRALSYINESISDIDEQVGTHEDRVNKNLDTAINVAKFPIERPVDTATAFVGSEVATGKDLISTISSKVTRGADTSLANVAQKGKELITPVVEKVKSLKPNKTSQKAFDESLELSRPAVTNRIEQEAISEGRVGKQGYVKGAKIAPSLQETRQAESLQPLIEDGRISIRMFKKDPTKVQKVIGEEVSRTNDGVKSLVHSPKYDLPVTNQELDSVIQAAKENNRILFGGDATIEKAYDTVIEEFKKNFLKRQTTGGIFDARQEFGDYIRNNFPKAFEDEILTGAVNPRAQALRDIYSSANAVVANKLDAVTSARVLNKLEPKVARKLIEKARSFKNKEDFITYAKKNIKDFPESEFASGTTRKNQTRMNTENQYTTREEDLGELWDISRSNVVSSTGELYTAMLRREADLLTIMKKNIPTKLKGITKKGRISSAIEKVSDMPLVKTAAAVGGAGAVLYGGAKAVEAATN